MTGCKHTFTESVTFLNSQRTGQPLYDQRVPESPLLNAAFTLCHPHITVLTVKRQRQWKNGERQAR
jgi:hypothetical protein